MRWWGGCAARHQRVPTDKRAARILCDSDPLPMGPGHLLSLPQLCQGSSPAKAPRIWGSRTGTWAQAVQFLSWAELSCSFLSGNQGFRSGSNFCWHSFMKSWCCKFLLRVTILSVQMVCRITKPAAINRTKFALHWSSKECAGRPGVGPPVCSVLFGILVTLLPAGWPEGLGPYRQVNQSKKK